MPPWLGLGGQDVALGRAQREAREDGELLAVAVQDLVYHLERMTGAPLPVIEVAPGLPGRRPLLEQRDREVHRQGRGGGIKPFQFDLTDAVDRQGENAIALQVIRRNYLNEIGLGGLLYPRFVFAGPRLENPAPQVEPLRRVLPGGAQGELEE